MIELYSDSDIDQLIWSIIEDSRNSGDYINFILQSSDREFDIEACFESATQYWGQIETEPLWPKVLQRLEEIARTGSIKAIMRLGNWYRHGYGVPIDSEKSKAWYKEGMELFDADCFMAYGFMISNTDPDTAKALLQRAVELGCTMAHIYWADLDKFNYMEHMAKGASTRNAHAIYCYGHDCLKFAKTDEEKLSALEIIKDAANVGSSAACVELGFSYLYGFGGAAEDKDASEYWFLRGAKLGNPISTAALGRLMLRNHPQKSEEALKFLFRASMMGDANGQFYLGEHLRWCAKTEQDLIYAHAWLEASAKQEYKPAYYLLGEMHRLGVGVEANLHTAHEWYKIGSEAGQTDCQCAYGLGLLIGEIVPKDEEQAHNLFYLASMQGSSWGTYFLGRSYEDGSGVPKDLKKAFDCYKKGAEQNYEKACFALAMAYLYGEGVDVNLPAAARWFKVASDLGHTDAKVYLGFFFLNGTGVLESTEKALFWFISAAEGGSKLAMRELGTLYFEGTKVTLDFNEAKRWMSKAAANGDETSIQWIKENCPQKPKWLTNLMSDTK